MAQAAEYKQCPCAGLNIKHEQVEEVVAVLGALQGCCCLDVDTWYLCRSQSVNIQSMRANTGHIRMCAAKAWCGHSGVCAW